MVMHACNPNTTETEVGGFWVGDQPQLHNEFKANLDYTVKPCLKKKE
jgi:hypothetical protein